MTRRPPLSRRVKHPANSGRPPIQTKSPVRVSHTARPVTPPLNAVAPPGGRTPGKLGPTGGSAERGDAPGLAADVALAVAGDRVAFERVYRAHVDRVYSVCVRMTADRALAEELTQDTFVRAWQKLSLFRGAEQLRHMAASVGGERRAQCAEVRRGSDSG